MVSSLSLFTMWEPGVFKGTFLHLKVPSTCTCCILFTLGCAKMITVVLLCSHHYHKHFHIPWLGEKGCPPSEKMLAWSIMGFRYRLEWAPQLHWSGSSPFRLWRHVRPHRASQSPTMGFPDRYSLPAGPTMRSPLVTNLPQNTWPSGVWALPFNQSLHSEDGVLRVGKTTPAVWRSTLKEKKTQWGQIQGHLPYRKSKRCRHLADR